MLREQNKERILKSAKEKHQVTYKSKLIRISSDLSTEALTGEHRTIYLKL
jgi:hypothetical protein